MSMYNMINGVNPSTFLIFPTLEMGHPDNFPRFRDCFLDEEYIVVYCRMGGDNGNCWEDGKENCECLGCRAMQLEKRKDFVSRKNDEFDNTYCEFTFRIPEKFKNDIELIRQGKLRETSNECKELIIKTFPKLSEEFTKLFGENE